MTQQGNQEVCSTTPEDTERRAEGTHEPADMTVHTAATARTQRRHVRTDLHWHSGCKGRFTKFLPRNQQPQLRAHFHRSRWVRRYFCQLWWNAELSGTHIL